VVPNSYLGDRTLVENPVSPFEPAEVETTNRTWLIVTGCILLLLAIIMAIICIRRVMQKNKEDKEALLMNNAEKEKLIEEAKKNTESFGAVGEPVSQVARDQESGYSIN
jgi:hypothetical protein